MRRPETFRSRFQYPLWWWNLAVAVAAWIFLIARGSIGALIITLCVAVPFGVLWWLGFMEAAARRVPAISRGWFWMVIYAALLTGVCIACTIAAPEATVVVLYALFLAGVCGVAVVKSLSRNS